MSREIQDLLDLIKKTFKDYIDNEIKFIPIHSIDYYCLDTDSIEFFDIDRMGNLYQLAEKGLNDRLEFSMLFSNIKGSKQQEVSFYNDNDSYILQSVYIENDSILYESIYSFEITI